MNGHVLTWSDGPSDFLKHHYAIKDWSKKQSRNLSSLKRSAADPRAECHEPTSTCGRGILGNGACT